MMIRFFKLIVVVVSLFCMQNVLAYIYEFSNHTNEPLKVRIQLHQDPVWYEKIIPAKTEGTRATVQFRFTHALDPEGTLHAWKGGFCLQEIQYAQPLKKQVKMIAPDGEDLGTVEKIVKDAQGNIQFGPWLNVVSQYVQNEGANAIIEASKAFADSLQSIAAGAADIFATTQEDKRLQKEEAANR